MAEFRRIDFTCTEVEGTLGHLHKLRGADHEALAVFFPSKNQWDVTCSCDDPSQKTGKSRWIVTGDVSALDVVKEKFQFHLSYFNRPKTKVD